MAVWRKPVGPCTLPDPPLHLRPPESSLPDWRGFSILYSMGHRHAKYGFSRVQVKALCQDQSSVCAHVCVIFTCECVIVYMNMNACICLCVNVHVNECVWMCMCACMICVTVRVCICVSVTEYVYVCVIVWRVSLCVSFSTFTDFCSYSCFLSTLKTKEEVDAKISQISLT